MKLILRSSLKIALVTVLMSCGVSGKFSSLQQDTAPGSARPPLIVQPLGFELTYAPSLPERTQYTGVAVRRFADGTSIALGNATLQSPPATHRLIVLHVDGGGNILWQLQLPDRVATGPDSLVIASDGSAIFGGYYFDRTGVSIGRPISERQFAMKVNSSGQILWDVNSISTYEGRINAVHIDLSGMVRYVGYHSTSAGFSGQLMTGPQTGGFASAYTHPKKGIEFTSITETTVGQLFVGVTDRSPGTLSRAQVFAFPASGGRPVELSNFPLAGSVNAIRSDGAGGVIAVGIDSSYRQGWAAHIGSDFRVNWQRLYSSPTGQVRFFAVERGSQGQFFVTGTDGASLLVTRLDRDGAEFNTFRRTIHGDLAANSLSWGTGITMISESVFLVVGVKDHSTIADSSRLWLYQGF